MTDESDHDILIDMRADLRHLVESHDKLEKRIYGEDGTGGLCGEVDKIKGQQLRWLGRDGVIVAGISAIIPTIALFLSWRNG